MITPKQFNAAKLAYWRAFEETDNPDAMIEAAIVAAHEVYLSERQGGNPFQTIKQAAKI